MGRIVFKIAVLPLLYFISVWPFFLLYRLSDFLFIIVYYVTGYRKKVVLLNLKNSFPEKSTEEIHIICRQFYRHFCDAVVEILKLLTISDAEFKRRFYIVENGQSVFRYFEEKKQSVVGVMGHCGNWEWGAIAHQFYFNQLITGVYHPLSNKNFDEFMLKLRGRKGGNIVAMKNLFRELIRLKSSSIPTTIGLIGDQTPPPETAYWTTFLNQDTPVFNGPEKLARKFNYPVIYVSVYKKKRGFYEMDARIITEEPNSLPEGKITELHTKALEYNIQQQPYIWLWTHKRWKHKRKD